MAKKLRGKGWLKISTSLEKEPLIVFHEPEDPIDGGGDAAKLLYSHDEVEVKRYREHPTRAIRHFRVVKAISPFLFYTEFDHERFTTGFNNWHRSMQQFYNNYRDPTLETLKVKTTNLLKYRCYVIKDEETGLWERVRVMKYCTQTKRAEVYMFEVNEFRIVSKVLFMELNPEYASWTAHSFPTHLMNIQPAMNAQYWSTEACKYFKTLVEDRSFSTVIITRTVVPFPEGFPEVLEYMGVTMIQRRPKKKMTLQGEMIKAGFAEPTGPLGGYDDIFSGKVGSFDLAKFEKEPPRVFKTLIDDNPKPTPTASQVHGYLEKIVQKSEMIRQSLGVGSALDVPYDFVPDMSKRHSSAPTNSSHLADIFKHALCQVRFSHIVCPSVLYVQLENKINELRELECALSLVVEDAEQIPFEDCTPGLLIACLIQVDRYREPSYVRAVVRQQLHGVKLLKVILIDYGLDISVKHTFSRLLPDYFGNIPGFAYRIHLDCPMLVPTGGRQWSSDASDTFRKYMSVWNQQLPIYYAWRPSKASTVNCEDFNEELHWDPGSHNWISTGAHASSMNAAVNSFHNHPLLQNLFTSFGADVVYEIIAKDDKSDYAFESLGDVLTESGFAIKLMPVKSMWGQHYSIVTTVMKDKYIQDQKKILAGGTVDLRAEESEA